MTDSYWPLFDIRLSAGDVELRPTVDADLRPLAEMLPADVELDPARPGYGLPTDPGTWTYQSYWRSVGNWRSESWNLQFSVFSGGHLVGVQCLEADEFARRRTVDSSSWLAAAARGRGIGKTMRWAVLTLAFEALGAHLAVTEAWHDNHASLGVSRSLGYVDNGWYMHDREPWPGGATEAGVDRMTRMRLTREDWLRNAEQDVTVENVTPCLAYFGI